MIVHELFYAKWQMLRRLLGKHDSLHRPLNQQSFTTGLFALFFHCGLFYFSKSLLIKFIFGIFAVVIGDVSILDGETL